LVTAVNLRTHDGDQRPVGSFSGWFGGSPTFFTYNGEWFDRVSHELFITNSLGFHASGTIEGRWTLEKVKAIVMKMQGRLAQPFDGPPVPVADDTGWTDNFPSIISCVACTEHFAGPNDPVGFDANCPQGVSTVCGPINNYYWAVDATEGNNEATFS